MALDFSPVNDAVASVLTPQQRRHSSVDSMAEWSAANWQAWLKQGAHVLMQRNNAWSGEYHFREFAPLVLQCDVHSLPQLISEEYGRIRHLNPNNHFMRALATVIQDWQKSDCFKSMAFFLELAAMCYDERDRTQCNSGIKDAVLKAIGQTSTFIRSPEQLSDEQRVYTKDIAEKVVLAATKILSVLDIKKRTFEFQTILKHNPDGVILYVMRRWLGEAERPDALDGRWANMYQKMPTP